MQVTVGEAKTQLPRLIEAALSGEEVVVAPSRTPVVRLTPLPRQGFRLGSMARLLPSGATDFLEPMLEDEPALWEGAGDGDEGGGRPAGGGGVRP